MHRVNAVIRRPDLLPLITTKLQCPQYHGTMVERAAVSQVLSAGDVKVLLVLAPAGCGKTVFLSQLARAADRPVAWYSLEPNDNDPIGFIRHLATALGRHLSLDEIQLHRLISKADPDGLCRAAVSFFAHALERAPRGALIVLDGWQAITHPVIYRLVSSLVPLLPPQVQLAVGGRNPLDLIWDLALERLHLAGQVRVITRRDLQFTPEELESFFALRCASLERERFSFAATLSAGWPIIVNFLTQMPSGASEDDDQVPYALASYIDREILEGEPVEVLNFLTKTAVFSSFTIDDCDELLGRSFSREIIRHLENHQLFLEVSGDEYSLVPIMRRHLLSKLGPERQALYKKAGSIAAARGQLHQAINCFLEAGERRAVADLVVRCGGEAALHGKWQDLGEWLERVITPDELLSNPRLSLLRSLVEIGRGQLGQAQKEVEQVESLFRLSSDELGIAECKLLKARISRGRGAIQESFNFLYDAETKLSTSRFKLLLDIEKSIIYYASGRLRESQDLLRQCLEENEGTGDTEALARILEALGNVTYLLGEYPRALQLFKRASALCPEGVMLGYDLQDMLSAIYDDWGETEQALLIAERSAAVRQKMGLTELLPSSFLQLALVYTNLGRFEEAERYFLQGAEYVKEHDGDRTVLSLNLAFLARTLAIQGKWVAARSYADEALDVAEPLTLLNRTAVAALAGPILARTGSWDQGMKLLKRSEKHAREMGFLKCLAYGLQAQAYLYFLRGDLSEARHYTRKALTVSAKINDLQNFVTCYHWYHHLLMEGLKEGIETSFVLRVLRKVGQASLKHLLPLARQGDPATKERIIPILIEIEDPEALNALADLREDPCDYVRNMAAEAYENRIGPRTALVPTSKQRTLTIYLLGPVRIFADGEEITAVRWRSHRARDLLVYLVHAKQPVSKDQIIEALWSEDNGDYERTDAKFHTTLYRLRVVLKRYGLADLIKHGTDVYTLAMPVATDLTQFETLLKSALSQEENSVEQMHLLEEALQNYHGDYLEYLDYDWAVPDREALRLRYLEGRLRLAKCYLAAKQYEQAINELVLLLQKDELNETYHSLLIEAYAQSGQRQAAQRQYELLTEILAAELGVKPSLDTQKLYEKLNLGSPQ